jgi:hypothetical protein
VGPDPHAAVRAGARLFSAPEHPAFARWAIARPGQIEMGRSPYADDRVRELTAEQVDRYAILFDAFVAEARLQGRGPQDIVPEVLSTQPYPVARVLQRHRLGRFRVTQKASLNDALDVYRGENARPEDWIMAGTHDTAPIWRVAEAWLREGTATPHALYLASRLVPEEGARSAWARKVAASPRALARAQLADLFVGPARNVMIFFADLLGLRDVYNRPGTVSDENWSLRVPPDFAEAHARAAREGSALDLPAALAAAMRARGLDFARAHASLVTALERSAGPAPDAP